MKKMYLLHTIALVSLFTGCATMASNELDNARAAYQHASQSPTITLVPAELHKAHEALVLAEDSFVKQPDSYKTKDLAYVAQRKSELADALGVMAGDKARTNAANKVFQKTQTEIVQQGKEDLRDAELQGKQDLIASEIRSADALAELAKLATIREEQRGLVVTLSGSILFRSGKSTLLTTAQTKLDQVANALLSVKSRNLIIEGHTDSQGTKAFNQELSLKRAEAVRDYLVKQGYPADHILALGKGEESPIANNASAEGRANNRRVEIVIEQI